MFLKKSIYSLIVFIYLFFFSFNYPEVKKIIRRDFKGNKYNYSNLYVAYLEIPKIGFKRGLYDINSPLNNVNNDIAFLDNTEYPNNNSNTVIIGHSGNSNKAYFNDLKLLELNDLIYFYYNNFKYEFVISNIYLVNKTGNVDVIKNKDKMTLTLITCYLDDYQLVIIANKKDL